MIVGPLKKGKHHDAARDMAEEYRVLMKEARQALADRDVTEYNMRRAQMESLLRMGFVDSTLEVAFVKNKLTQEEIHTPFGVLEIGGWSI